MCGGWGEERGKDWPLQITSGSSGKAGGKADQEQQMSNQFLYRNDDNPEVEEPEEEEKVREENCGNFARSVCFSFDWGKVRPPFPLFPALSHSLCSLLALCVLTFKQFSGSQRSDNDDAGQTASGRAGGAGRSKSEAGPWRFVCFRFRFR